jgi:ATPase subunit of ABC transporter with duplicated ATPase domains
MRPLLGGEVLQVAYPDRQILGGVSLGLGEGDRIGVVGRNGDGKSTLMRVLARRQEPDDGRVTWRRDLRVGFLEQADVLDPDLSVRRTVVGDGPEHLWAREPRIRAVIDGLLGDVDGDALVGTLSGGQRRRVALAQVLAGEHDVVFLDEPTNHLDLEGVTWLAEHVRTRWPAGTGGLAVVTHDRWFLDEVCTHTWEVHDGVVDAFEGGYAAYVLQRVERDRQAAASESRRRNLMRKELAWLRRGAPARTSKPKFRIDAANALIEREPPIRDQVELVQLATARLGKDVVDLLDASVAYDGRTVLDSVEWRIGPGERAGILGVNGAGKSTLLGLVTGTVRPTSGRVKRGKTVQVGVLTQSMAELDDLADDRVADVVEDPGDLLERLGFGSSHLGTRVRDLSGGQKRRLQLLLVLLQEPNVLVLDEPTNDLDTDMLAAVEDLLDTWPGTLLVVSHDRYLLERVTDHQYAVLDGRLRHLPGGVDEYLRLRKESFRQVQGPIVERATVLEPVERTSDAKTERETKKAVARLERQIEKLAAQEAELEKAMINAGADADLLRTLHLEHQEVARQREAAEDEWLALTT